jgi:hypothetical protein
MGLSLRHFHLGLAPVMINQVRLVGAEVPALPAAAAGPLGAIGLAILLHRGGQVHANTGMFLIKQAVVADKPSPASW